MQSNFLDRAIGYISPVAGVRRAAARFQMEVARGFDGAKRGPRALTWKATGASANAEIMPALSTLRNRSRDLIRNNGYMKHAIAVKTANMIGTGIVAKFANKKAQKVWKRWIKYCDANGQLNLYGLQAQIYRAWKESGECLVRFRNRLPTDGLEVPLQIQVLEADYLDSSKTGPTDTGFMIAGVQFNMIGVRVGYWLFDQHPGEMATVPRNMLSKLVPASEVIHLYDVVNRPGAVRGFPEAAVSFWRIRDLAEYQDAELVRKKVESCFAVFMTRGDGNQVNTSALGDPVSEPPVTKLSPGMIKVMNDIDDVKFAAPLPGNGYGEHVEIELRAIAAGWDITYEQLSGDYSNVNFTSGRLAKMEFKRVLEQEQWLIFIPMVLDRIADRVMNTAYLANGVPSPDIDRDWTAPRIEMTDPLKEAKAIIAQIGAKLISRPEAQRQLGYDPELQDAEIQGDKLRVLTPDPGDGVSASSSSST